MATHSKFFGQQQIRVDFDGVFDIHLIHENMTAEVVVVHIFIAVPTN